ncbi:MAG: hypothetical protein ACLR23_14690 [Clostridia bacterium]
METAETTGKRDAAIPGNGLTGSRRKARSHYGKIPAPMSGSLSPTMRAEGLTRLWYWNTRRGWGSSTPRPAPTLRWPRSTASPLLGL